MKNLKLITVIALVFSGCLAQAHAQVRSQEGKQPKPMFDTISEIDMSEYGLYSADTTEVWNEDGDLIISVESDDSESPVFIYDMPYSFHTTKDFSYSDGKHRKKERGWRFKRGRYSGFTLNFNHLIAPKDIRYLGLTPKSIGVEIGIFDFTIASSNRVALVTGLGFEFNNFRFEDNITLTKDATGMIVPDYSYDNRGIIFKKTKLTTSYMNIPLLVQVNLGKNYGKWKNSQMWLSGGVIGGVLLNGHTKVKTKEFGKEKNHNNLNLRNFHYGFHAAVGYSVFALTVKYYPHSIFRDGLGPDAQQLNIGLSILF